VIQQKLADDNPAVSEFRASQALTHIRLGSLEWQTGKSGESLESYRRALVIYQKRADDNPAVTEFRKNLAISHSDVGLLLGQLGKPAEALESFRRALAIQQKLWGPSRRSAGWFAVWLAAWRL
jgi:eukaryotic-like serine/threonine-protein kinase